MSGQSYPRWKPQSTAAGFSPPPLTRRFRRTLLLLAFIAITLFLFSNILSFRKQKSGPYVPRPPPEYAINTKPHFLYTSPFRKDPDLDFEEKLEDALKAIENDALSGNGRGEDDDNLGRLWQVMLQKNSDQIIRRPESEQFEQHNSEWPYTLITTEWANKFIDDHFSSVPDLIRLYNSYPSDVLRADVIRYLVLWYYGGYYADMDVFPKRSINTCPSLEPILGQSSRNGHVPPNISLVVGIEIDEPYATEKLMQDWHWSRRYGFIQYNLYAPRRFSPVLRRVIVRVLAHTKRHNNKSSFLRGPQYDERATLEVTGPGVFTDVVIDVLTESLPSKHHLVTSSVEADNEAGELTPGETRVTWAPFYKLKEPIWIHASEAADGKDMGGLGVLPINVWGNGQRHSGAENFRSEHACINHLFKGTWKWRGLIDYLFSK